MEQGVGLLDFDADDTQPHVFFGCPMIKIEPGASLVTDESSLDANGVLVETATPELDIAQAEFIQPEYDILNEAQWNECSKEGASDDALDAEEYEKMTKAIESIMEGKDVERRMYECPICSEMFYEEYALKTHMTQGHVKRVSGTAQKRRCDICGKQFTSKQYLKQHVLIHTFKEKFNCDVCGKTFAQNSNLKTHLLIHAEEKKFKCHMCGKRFTVKGNLKAHLLTHYDVRQFECDVCGKKFTQKSNLKTHSLTHSEEKKYACNVCGKRFTVKNHLTRHATRHL